MIHNPIINRFTRALRLYSTLRHRQRTWKFTVCLLFVFGVANAVAQVTITLHALPPRSEGPYFAAGNFNRWNPADTQFIFHTIGDKPTLTFIPGDTGAIEFKITRGSWESVETTADGKDIPNRKAVYQPGMQLTVAVEGWHDSFEHEQPQLNPDVIHSELYAPQLHTTKYLRILLPPDYATSAISYPVIYMFDGQNLFDDATSFSGEWAIDETMQQMYADSMAMAIIVGVDNAGTGRIDEYLPWRDSTYGGGNGEACIRFIVETLKPHIDSIYRTQPGRAHTYIAGSSLGGLMSLYAVLRNSDVFANAFIFSPAFWIAPPLFEMADTTAFNGPTFLYFAAGGKEGESMIPEMQRMYAIITENGDKFGHYRFIIEADANHSELFWRNEFPSAYKWFFKRR